MALLRAHPAIKSSLEHLLENDARFAGAGLALADVSATRGRFDLPALTETIVGQQLSTKAAATIWGRVVAALDVSDPRAYLSMTPEAFRALGVSNQKTRYIHGIAQAVSDGTIDLARLKRARNDDVIAALTSLKGFGLWSAQMMLIFALARPDVWPAGDLGVQEGLRLYRRLSDRPDARATQTYGLKKFGDHTTAAALLLWRLKDKPKQERTQS